MLHVVRRNLSQRRAALDAAEAALRSDEQEFQGHVRFFESRMGELTLLGSKVQAQSEAVAAQYRALASERQLVEAAKLEAKQFIQRTEQDKNMHEQGVEKLKEEKSKHDKEKSKLMQEQKKFLLDKVRRAGPPTQPPRMRPDWFVPSLHSFLFVFVLQDLALRQMSVSKSLQGPSASPIQQSRGGSFALEDPTLLSHSFHQAALPFDLGAAAGLGAAAPAPAFAIAAAAGSPPPISHHHAFARADHYASAHKHAYDSSHLSAALASLSSHADHLRGFMQDEKILSPKSNFY